MSEVIPETNLDDAATGADATGADTALAAAAIGEEANASAETSEVADDAAKADEAPSFLGAPEAYDIAAFAMPEGVEFDADLFEAVKDDLKAMDLSQDGAGKVVAMFAEKVAPKIAEKVQAQIEATGQELSAQFARDLQADPVVGGVKLKESQAMAAKAIATAIPDAASRAAFSQFLNESGLGNHPLLMRVIAAGGRAMGEATTPAGAAVAEKSTAEKFYGRSNA
jgi:hypothetical protein